jgi:hypothetical protein
MSPRLGQQVAVVAHRVPGRLIERDETFLFGLSTHHQHPRIVLSGGNWQRDELGDPQSGGVEHFDQARQSRGAKPAERRLACPVHVTVRLREETIDLSDTEHLRQRARPFRPFDHCRRIIAAASFRIKETKKLPNGGKPSPHGRGGETASGKRVEIGTQIFGRGIGNAAMGRAERCREIGEIPGVGGQRVLGSPTLGRNHVEEELDQDLIGPYALRSHGGGQGCFANLSGGM